MKKNKFSRINYRTRLGIDERSLEWLEKIFKQTVGNEKEIRREEFKKIVTSKNVSIVDFQELKSSEIHLATLNINACIFAAILHRESFSNLR